ncbi:unnamed protein product [Cylindrotheca closterium]|uniref:Uncharacterized protein n=1 Tax=Cylindrotheca closterium TaxID=2856 RepID=A0AAD2FF52_9STRA|nr:unnamed protein product [Cylindrotheca closterium]
MPYGRDKAKTQNVAAQAAFLSSKLNFGPPSKAAPQTPPRSKGVSKDPHFGANRDAIAAKLNFGGKKPPPGPKSPATIPKPSGGKEFQNQKAALAAKLNFRPPLPAGDPLAKPPNALPNRQPGPPIRPAQQVSSQNGTQDFSAHRAAIASQLAFGKSKPSSPPNSNPPPTRRRNDNYGTDFFNQKQALASKLVFRPPLPASPTSGGSQVSPLRPTTGMPRSPESPQETSYTPAPAAPAGHMGLAAQAAAMASGLKSRQPEDAITTTSSGAASPQSSRSMNDPPPEPEMSFAQPEMKFVRSYRIGGGGGGAEEEQPKEGPFTQVIPKQVVAGDENGRIQVVLVSEKFEWGTKPLNKKYRRNRVMVKRLTTNTPEEERKRERNKKGGGRCTIM